MADKVLVVHDAEETSPRFSTSAIAAFVIIFALALAMVVGLMKATPPNDQAAQPQTQTKQSAP